MGYVMTVNNVNLYFGDLAPASVVKKLLDGVDEEKKEVLRSQLERIWIPPHLIRQLIEEN